MFDLSNVETQNSFETIPAGKYLCSTTNAEIKDTASGTGQYIKVEFTVKHGTHEGRKIWTNFNVKNNNPKAVEIGLSQLKTMLVAAKYPTPDKLNGVTDLCGLTIGVKTKVKSDEQFGDKAEVSYFFDASKITENHPEENLPF
jgi:hypothetical protein